MGRLFIFYSTEMSSLLEAAFKSSSPLERATVTKSFKYGATKDTNQMDLQIFLEYLIKAVMDSDISVRRFALESLTAVTHV